MTGPQLDAVTVCAGDLDASVAFYEATLSAIGFVRTHELVDEEEDDAAVEAVGWGPPDEPAQVWAVTGSRPTTGLHLRLRVASRHAVERCHAAALGAGGVEHSAPRRWTPYRRGEFGAAVRDPDGNVLELVAPE